MGVELCHLRLKLKDDIDVIARYIFYKKHGNRKGSVVRAVRDVKRSLDVDNVIAIVSNDQEAMRTVRKDVRRLVNRNFLRLETKDAQEVEGSATETREHTS